MVTEQAIKPQGYELLLSLSSHPSTVVQSLVLDAVACFPESANSAVLEKCNRTGNTEMEKKITGVHKRLELRKVTNPNEVAVTVDTSITSPYQEAVVDPDETVVEGVEIPLSWVS